MSCDTLHDGRYCSACFEPVVADNIDELFRHWIENHPEHHAAYELFRNVEMWAICDRCKKVFAAEVEWSVEGPTHRSYCAECRTVGYNRLFWTTVPASEVAEYETPLSKQYDEMVAAIDDIDRRVTRIEIAVAVSTARILAGKVARRIQSGVPTHT